MGNITNSEENENEIYSRQYGRHVLVQNENSRSVVKYFAMSSKEEMIGFSNLIKKYMEYKIPTILPIIEAYPFPNNSSNELVYKVELKNIEKTLQKEIQEKFEEGSFYEEEEIIYVIDCVLSALLAFRMNNLFHSNIHPETILVDESPFIEKEDSKENNENEEKNEQFENIEKVYCTYLPLINNNSDLHQIISQKNYDSLFLSPQNLLEMKEGRIPLPTPSEKNDVWALGCIALEMSYLSLTIEGYLNKQMLNKETMNKEKHLNKYKEFSKSQMLNPQNWILEIYNFSTLEINFPLLRKKLEEISSHYSPAFIKLLELMLEERTEDRGDFEAVMKGFTVENEKEELNSAEKSGISYEMETLMKKIKEEGNKTTLQETEIVGEKNGIYVEPLFKKSRDDGVLKTERDLVRGGENEIGGFERIGDVGKIVLTPSPERHFSSLGHTPKSIKVVSLQSKERAIHQLKNSKKFEENNENSFSKDKSYQKSNGKQNKSDEKLKTDEKEKTDEFSQKNEENNLFEEFLCYANCRDPVAKASWEIVKDRIKNNLE